MLSHRRLADVGKFSLTDNNSQLRLGLSAVLPEQFFHVPCGQANQPEAALMRAVLEEALTCFQNQFYIRRDKVQQLARDAEVWFFSDETAWPFSFVNIC